jgi:hypothetical protein
MKIEFTKHAFQRALNMGLTIPKIKTILSEGEWILQSKKKKKYKVVMGFGPKLLILVGKKKDSKFKIITIIRTTRR